MLFRSVLLSLLLVSSSIAQASLGPEELKARWIQRLKDFSDSLTGLASPQSQACKEYALGESRRVLARHIATKLSEKKYRILMSAEFHAAEEVPADQAVLMREKVKACYKAAGALKASDQNELSFELLENIPSKLLQVPPSYIRVYTGGIRANSGNYHLDMDCPTILHETLHLVGLDDEYKESTEDMSCRSFGDSIMADHTRPHIEGLYAEADEYYRKESETIFLAVDKVLCRENNTDELYQFSYDESRKSASLWHFTGNDWQYSKLLDEQEGIYMREADLLPNSKFTLNEHTRRLMHLPESGSWRCRLEQRSATPKRLRGAEILAERIAKYPLRPAHFRKILFSKCIAKNQVYNYCTQESYLVVTQGHQCLKDKLPACNNGEWLN
jgi:hypothetical protein